MPYANKDQQRKFQREFLQKKKKDNPKWHSELKRRYKMKREGTHDIVSHIKSKIGCLLCGERDSRRLQFHHVIPELKEATIAQMISNRTKLIVILKEIDKCVCVCASCHKILQDNLNFYKNTISNERWFGDWGIKEALEWASFHPQSRLNKNNITEIIWAVVRNLQIQDLKKFRTSMLRGSTQF